MGVKPSLLAGVSICTLLLTEATARLMPATEPVFDKTPHGEVLRVDFNMSFLALRCESASLDVSYTPVTNRISLTSTVMKLPINTQLGQAFHSLYDNTQLKNEYDDPVMHREPEIDYSAPLTSETFQATLDRYPIVMVNFYAPWCNFSQRLEPTWEAVTQEVHSRYPESDRRLRFAKVDCMDQVQLCREHHIAGFPSLRIFKGHDEITLDDALRTHEAYNCTRTKEALLGFAASLAISAGSPQLIVKAAAPVAKASGCTLSGFALVKKVPGTLQFLAESVGHSFDHQSMSMSRVINYLYIGSKPPQLWQKASSRRQLTTIVEGTWGEGQQPVLTLALQRLQLGADEWLDKLASAANQQATADDHVQVVLTAIEPYGAPSEVSDAYGYSVQSRTFNTDTISASQFSQKLFSL